MATMKMLEQFEAIDVQVDVSGDTVVLTLASADARSGQVTMRRSVLERLVQRIDAQLHPAPKPSQSP